MTIQPFLAGEQICDANGKPVPGAKIYLYAAGTTSLLTPYSDRGGAVLGANPVVCDAAGIAPLFYIADLAWKTIVTDANDVLLRSYDNLGNPAGTLATSALVIPFIINGSGSPISPGIKGSTIVPVACTINNWTLIADQPGSIAVDIWGDTFSAYPASVADSITGSSPPSLSSAQKAQGSPTGTWLPSLSAFQLLTFNINSAQTLTRVTLGLSCTRT